MTYLINMPIGDWSNDGHGKCDYYLINSNTNPELLVDMYINADEKYNISSICRDYEQSRIEDYQKEDLIVYGFNPNKYVESNNYTDSKKLCQLVMDAIMKDNPDVILSFVPDIVDFNNWFGQKVKGVTSGGIFTLPGYGLFH